MSEDFLKQLGINKSEGHSIFEINPEWSYLKWKEVYKQETKDFIEIETSCLKADESIEKCTVKYLNVQPFMVYVISMTQSTENTDSVVANDKSKIQDTTLAFDYDMFSPNPVLYFDSHGRITFSNEKAVSLHLISDTIESAFLEPDSGPLLETMKAYKPKQEYVVRMIMKTKSGLKEGFSRISTYREGKKDKENRLEFIFAEDLYHAGEPLQEAMSELKRLSGVLSSSKEIMIEDSIDQFSLDDIVTQSSRYKRVLRQVATVADTNSTVLITGETGTGKEMLCKTLYKLSDRADEIIVKVNCATIPSNLIESILFGHEKGAFTDAKDSRIGKFELANKGTIFLDEIGEMPYDLQSKLLRVLQEGEIERLGNPEPIKVDVRVIAATNRNLQKLIKAKKFREDLYYRLNVFPIYNIPLRERKEDIPLLVQHFIKKANKKTGRQVKSIREQDMRLLSTYDFPGNVRELENIIERSVISSESSVLQLNTFHRNSKKDKSVLGIVSLEEAEKGHIIKALKICKGKVSGTNSASELLKINSKTLASRIKRHNINPKKYVTL